MNEENTSGQASAQSAGEFSGAAQTRKRKPVSFALRLTWGQGFRMLRLLLAVNVLVVVMYGVLLALDMEDTVQRLSALPPEQILAQSEAVSDLRVSLGEERTDLPFDSDGTITDLMHVGTGAMRWYAFVSEPGHHFVAGWDVRPLYMVEVGLPGGQYLRATFDLTVPLRRFCYALLVLITAEALFWLNHVGAAHRAVRKTLAPIQQLAIAAQSISVEVEAPPRRGGGPVLEDELSDTIDTLNRITAKRLDTRISIDDERVELRDLAKAINGMLDRLDAAYNSQLRFVSDASHELRTPIAVIQGYANLLDRWGKEDPAVLQESIEAIKSEAEGMKTLVEQLLFLARSDNNSIAMELVPLNLSEVVETLLRDTQVIAPRHNFSSDIAPGLWVRGDGALLKQTLRIFMDNALKYTPEGGSIKVSAAQLQEQVRVSVTDSGIGIPGQDIPHVFERFFRSDESRARATGGTGLGLSIAKWIIHRHGGNVELLSRPDIGTRLTMSLPKTPVPSEALCEEAVG